MISFSPVTINQLSSNQIFFLWKSYKVWCGAAGIGRGPMMGIKLFKKFLGDIKEIFCMSLDELNYKPTVSVNRQMD